ncbi:hypothetical protein [Streptomyces gibsoniae]|uniref:Universal stress protein n=1 Tax=Streptomyces gibsoniae TaxID=3075529 RepID=A0ABU2U9U9_9ACTN|nr:hypothetical protein [Streptomyces sp. DSM 41699]MDT0469816.1 hypothetical protein [Streptomyces sp. DSM 41699]
MTTARSGGRTAAAYPTAGADLTDSLLIIYDGSSAVVEFAALLAAGCTAVVLAPVHDTTHADAKKSERLAYQGALPATELGIKAGREPTLPGAVAGKVCRASRAGEPFRSQHSRVVDDVAEEISAWLVVPGPEAEPLVGHLEPPLMVMSGYAA